MVGVAPSRDGGVGARGPVLTLSPRLLYMLKQILASDDFDVEKVKLLWQRAKELKLEATKAQ